MMLLRIVSFSLLLAAAQSASAVTQLFCSGEEFHNDDNVGEVNYLVVFDDEFARYEVYQGMKNRAVMSGTAKTDRLFYYEYTEGDYDAIIRKFQLSRVTLKFQLGYTMRNGTYITANGQCERYSIQL